MSDLIYYELLSRIPQLQPYSKSDFYITPLEGLTNDNFRIEVAQDDWILRIPRAQTNALIDRAAESHNQILAAKLGIAPLPVWRDATGSTLTSTLRQARVVSPSDFASSETIEMIIAPVRRLHRSGFKFQGLIEAGAVLQSYFSKLPEVEQSRFVARKQEAEALLLKLVDRDLAPVASHIDLILENLLWSEQQLWLIDWEFSAMASPYWDLASLCNAADLDAKQARELLHCYCAGSPQMEESVLSDYRFLLQLISDCWISLVSS
ncbi:MAG: choline/ethanolamine kinase family protein [Pseudomonadota bacterium]